MANNNVVSGYSVYGVDLSCFLRPINFTDCSFAVTRSYNANGYDISNLNITAPNMPNAAQWTYTYYVGASTANASITLGGYFMENLQIVMIGGGGQGGAMVNDQASTKGGGGGAGATYTITQSPNTPITSTITLSNLVVGTPGYVQSKTIGSSGNDTTLTFSLNGVSTNVFANGGSGGSYGTGGVGGLVSNINFNNTYSGFSYTDVAGANGNNGTSNAGVGAIGNTTYTTYNNNGAFDSVATLYNSGYNASPGTGIGAGGGGGSIDTNSKVHSGGKGETGAIIISFNYPI